MTNTNNTGSNTDKKEESFYCHNCNNPLSLLVSSGKVFVGRKDECPQCKEDLHICLNCQFYDTGAYNSCRESSAEVVLDKDRANFCDYFVFLQGDRRDSSTGGKEELLAAAEELFNKKA